MCVLHILLLHLSEMGGGIRFISVVCRIALFFQAPTILPCMYEVVIAALCAATSTYNTDSGVLLWVVSTHSMCYHVRTADASH